MSRAVVQVRPVSVHDDGIEQLVAALTEELDQAGYGDEGTFGWDLARLAAAPVRLVGAEVGGRLVGLGGLEVDAEPDDEGGRTVELKRFYVEPDHRGTGVADALLDALLRSARDAGVDVVRLETGDAQHAALRFYRRRRFVDVPRFGPYVDSPRSVCLELRLDRGRPTPSLEQQRAYVRQRAATAAEVAAIERQEVAALSDAEALASAHALLDALDRLPRLPPRPSSGLVEMRRLLDAAARR